MRVGVIGINHKLANLDLRELLAQACQRRFMLGGACDGNHTFVLLTTCNRTEVYFTSDDLANTHTYLLQVLRQDIDDDFDQKVYSFFGHDCFLHLCRVTAGLDSAIVAETEIQGQVKGAYESISEKISLPREMHYLFQKALKVGKKVRSELCMGRGMPDLEHAVFQLGQTLFPSIHETKVLFVGASEVNCKIITMLKSKKIEKISLCNRSHSRASVLAEENGLMILDWKNLHQWPDYDWIIFGTKSPGFLVSYSQFNQRLSEKKLIIDLCVPRNVDPSLNCYPEITLLNIDQINRILHERKLQMAQTLLRAEQMIANSAKHYVECFQARSQRVFA